MKCEQAARDLKATESKRIASGGVSLTRSGEFKPAGGLAPRVSRMRQSLLLVALLVFAPALLLGKVTGSISGTAKDTSGAVIPGVSVEALNTATGVVQKIATDPAGFYNFSALPIGRYTVSFHKEGFQGYEETNLVIDVDTALRVDAVLQVGAVKQEVTVQGTAAQVDTRTTQTGEVIGGKEMTDIPLNGRAFTDLLALQPGVVPINTSQYGSLSPSGTLNAGVLSMSGQQDVNNGFMVNGANTVEGYDGGTIVVPNLDSIAEFRIITSTAGAEYGNYSGGQINVVTKSGTNQFHGDAFEFLRNSDMDSRNFYSPSRGVLHQNMFGGTFGGPIRRNKIFFFGDYQGTRQVIGVDTGDELVPSMAERNGDLSDRANQLTGTVGGSYFAGILSAGLGYPVTAGESYYTSGCTSSANCVFPGAVIPKAAWSTVSPNVIPLIPLPNSGPYYTTSAYPETLRDDKGGVRIDANTRLGMLSGYYHFDPWAQLSPYSYDGEGSTVPGFPYDNLGKAQLLTFSATTSIGPTAVNQLTFSYIRNKSISGVPISYNANLTPQALGFAPAAEGGIYQYSAKFGTVPEMSFNNFGLGAISNEGSQYNSTYQGQDDFSKIVGAHTLKFGADYHIDRVEDADPNNNQNGDFSFTGDETGLDFADMLVGAPAFFVQAPPFGFNVRTYYLGAYGQDSWRVTHNLTLNYGVRWEVSPFWFDQQGKMATLIEGDQSKIFPGAPLGFVFPGDPGVPGRITNTRYNDFAPRLGLAYSPNFSNGFLHKIFGDSGKSSIRVGYGIYYTAVRGSASNNLGAPFNLYYVSSAPPLFATPFITRSSGQNLQQRFPLPPPPTHLSPNSPDTNVNWAQFEPLSGYDDPTINDKTPYGEHVNLSIQRQLAPNTLLTLAYVGTFGHHLLVDIDNNPGNPQLCSSLSQTTAVLPNTPTCGPFGENGVYHPVTGGVVNGTRAPFGELFSGTGYFLDMGNSDYHALEVVMRHTTGRAQFLLAYTFSKSMDNGSGFGDQVLPTLPANYHAFEALSAFDITNNFSFSYTYEIPFDKLFQRNNRATRGWKVSGVTEFTTGVPVQISEPDDQSLVGNTSNSPFSGSTDEPNYTPGSIFVNRNPRNQSVNANGVLVNPYFNPSLFSREALGGQGTSGKRFFHGPGINNWNIALLKDVKLTESKTLEFRGELFNAFNHAQFYGSGAVDGNFDAGSSAFGGVFSAAAPRVAQVAAKIIF